MRGNDGAGRGDEPEMARWPEGTRIRSRRRKRSGATRKMKSASGPPAAPRDDGCSCSPERMLPLALMNRSQLSSVVVDDEFRQIGPCYVDTIYHRPSHRRVGCGKDCEKDACFEEVPHRIWLEG